MGKPSAPAAPDYAAAAKAQGEANVNSGLATNYLNQANQVGPNGSMTYSYNPSQGHTLADGTFIPQTTATTTLSPQQQGLYDQQNQISSQLNSTALNGIGYVQKAAGTPIDQSNLPSMAKGLAASPFSGTPNGTTQPLSGSYDFSKVGAMPNSNDFQGQRDQITNAMMSRLQPQMDHDTNALAARQAAQGITPGSEAANWDSKMLNEHQNDQRTSALLAGNQEQQARFGEAMGIRGQGVQEAVGQGQFGNSANAQQFGQNQGLLQDRNQAAQGNFGQGLASGQFSNSARAQAIQEGSYFRNEPLNMLNALRTGNQASMPQFGNVAGGASIAPAPVYQASQDQYGAAMDSYKAQLQASSALMSGVGALGGAAITHWSDRRLKQNIELVSIRPDGLGVYDFDYIWGGGRQRGVMADEVATFRPEALGPLIGGYATVNYGAL